MPPDQVAAFVRDIMAERSSWTGAAADLLRAGAERAGDGILRRSRLAQKPARARWPPPPPPPRADIPPGIGH
jgi:hypothetical protein